MEYTKESVINRLFNCKFDSAYRQALTLNLSEETLVSLAIAAESYGNCGWGGKVIDKASDKLIKQVKDDKGKY